ncbi:pilus assembly protein PilX [Pseudoalteromonas fenneropenaei]|uniref:Pilus assembly protein PilX n=1 Tax=Pseudoalteromonas fenneropenaei TaxID=1737459 RepID=A0ABV7CMN1_9GAMM
MALMMSKQRGVVLVVAMVMLVAVTAVAVTLMSSSSIDLKITNAAQEREAADLLLIGEVQRVIAEQAAQGQASLFLRKKEQIPQGVSFAGQNGSQNVLTSLNNGPLDLRCPRQYGYTEGVVCNFTQLETTIEYGSKSRHKVTIVTGVSQEILDPREAN